MDFIGSTFADGLLIRLVRRRYLLQEPLVLEQLALIDILTCDGRQEAEGGCKVVEAAQVTAKLLFVPQQMQLQGRRKTLDTSTATHAPRKRVSMATSEEL
jgi:hypothetical protein